MDELRKDDILKGAEEIAEFLNEDVRSVFYKISRRSIPHFRIGESIRARKSTLLAWIAEQEGIADGRGSDISQNRIITSGAAGEGESMPSKRIHDGIKVFYGYGADGIYRMQEEANKWLMTNGDKKIVSITPSACTIGDTGEMYQCLTITIHYVR